MSTERPDIPRMIDVENATPEQLARWYRFLPVGETPEDKRITDRIAARVKEMGGISASLSEKIGYKGV